MDRGALSGDCCKAILNREAYSTLCRKELRPDLFNKDDPCTVAASDRFNVEHKRRIQDEVIIGVEQKVTKVLSNTCGVAGSATELFGSMGERRTVSLRYHRGPATVRYSRSLLTCDSKIRYC